MPLKQKNQQTIEAYLTALENGVSREKLGAFFTADARQIEYPNKLNPGGGESDLQTILKRYEQGKSILREQTIAISSIIADGNKVAVEAFWSGVLAVTIGSLQPGDEMTAHLAIFFELKDGRIHRQYNYDCYQAWD